MPEESGTTNLLFMFVTMDSIEEILSNKYKWAKSITARYMTDYKSEFPIPRTPWIS